MGLGKTMQTIATMLLNRPDPNDDDAPKTTLILAPVALLEQWEREILEWTDEETFSTLIYHGTKRAKKAEDIEKYDVVITSL